jgi:hypothetical protein
VVFMVLVNTMWFSQLREKAGLNFWCGVGDGEEKYSAYVMTVMGMVAGN